MIKRAPQKSPKVKSPTLGNPKSNQTWLGGVLTALIRSQVIENIALDKVVRLVMVRLG